MVVWETDANFLLVFLSRFRWINRGAVIEINANRETIEEGVERNFQGTDRLVTCLTPGDVRGGAPRRQAAARGARRLALLLRPGRAARGGG